MIAEFITPEDLRWSQYLAKNHHDFYHLPEYVKFCAKYENAIATAFYAEDEKAAFLAPLLIRPIPISLGAPASWYDCASPYGYSTPLITPSENSLYDFLEAFCHAARRRGIVTAFFRLHPFLRLNHGVLEQFGLLMKHGQTVYIDLAQSEDEIWAQERINHKRDIQRLQRLGFKVNLDDWRFLPDFIGVYQKTMQRVDAGEVYMFSQSYFHELKSALGDRVHLSCVLTKDDKVAAAGLFIETAGLVQYHLGGTVDEYLSLAPSKLMCDFMWRWAKKRSSKVFHLGGGVGGMCDSLFHYKAGYSKARADCFTYRMVLDEWKNETLIRLAETQAGERDNACSYFFPAYRRL
jgi:hypothetical protein